MQFDRTAAANSCRIISVRFSRKCFVSLAPQASSEDSLCSQCSIMWRTLSPQSDSSAANQSLPLCLRQPPHRLVTLKPFQTHLTPPVVAATAFFLSLNRTNIFPAMFDILLSLSLRRPSQSLGLWQSGSSEEQKRAFSVPGTCHPSALLHNASKAWESWEKSVLISVNQYSTSAINGVELEPDWTH